MSVKIDGNGIVTPLPPLGQCRLNYVNTSLVQLVPYKGNKLSIQDTYYAIPSAGVSLTPTGLSAPTLYYVYAYMNSGTMTLEASTTGHSTDTTYGIEIKTGDPTRSLVGMVYTQIGPIFVDSAAIRLVSSWFNRTQRSAVIGLGSNISTTSNSAVEIDSTYRVSMVVWAGDNVHVQHSGSVICNAPSTVYTTLYTTGALGTGYTNAATAGTIPTATYFLPATCGANAISTADGFVQFQVHGNTGTGTASWIGGVPGSNRSALSASFQG